MPLLSPERQEEQRQDLRAVPSEVPRVAPPRWLVLTAFLTVYLIWGSTYFSIRVAVETMPPFLMAGSRFLMAGLCLYGFSRARGEARPHAINWRSSAIVGALLLPLGNGTLSWAERTVPSGLCALMIAATPLWMILIEWLRPRGRAPGWQVGAGLLLGFAGVAIIVSTRDALGQRTMPPLAALALLSAPAAWALGSIYSRHAPQTKSSLLNIGMQMICGGAVMLLIGALAGEAGSFHLASVSTASWQAFAYLTVFGSMIGFTAYVWLLQVSTPARVSTYAYVNPLIAVLLGHWLLREPLSPMVVVAGALILGAVLALTSVRAASK